MDEQKKLAKIRAAYKEEMQKAITCQSSAQKKYLAQTWKRKYSEATYHELIRIARDKEARLRIAEWELDDFDSSRKKTWTSI